MLKEMNANNNKKKCLHFFAGFRYKLDIYKQFYV